MDPITLLIILLCLVACSAFYAASEIAIVSLPQVLVEEIRKKNPKIAMHLDYHRKKAQRFVINISIANNFINIFASSLATAAMVALFPKYGVVIATVGMTALILLFGEIIPKVIAINHTQKVAEKSATPLWISAIVLTPLIWVFSLVVKLFSKNAKDSEEVTESALQYYVSKGFESGAIDKQEKLYIQNILRMDTITIEDVMTPLRKITSCSTSTTVAKVKAILIKSGFSRIPIFDEHEPSKFIGMIHAKNLLNAKDTTRVSKLMHKPHFVSSVRKTDDVLQDFQKEDNHFAIVLNGEGHHIGIVTLEDVIEEIIGEIYDETDRKVIYLKKINKNTYHIQGEFDLFDFNKKFKTKYKGAKSVAGFIANSLERVPVKGDVVRTPLGVFEVMSVVRQRIRKIKFIQKKTVSK